MPASHNTISPLRAIKIEVPKSGWIVTKKIGNINITIGINKFLKLFIL